VRTICPGPGRADECEHRACRYGGCQGRPPAPREPRDILPDIEIIAATVLAMAEGRD